MYQRVEKKDPLNERWQKMLIYKATAAVENGDYYYFDR